MDEQPLEVRDLIMAAVYAKRWSNSRENVSSYFTQRYEILRAEAGIQFDLSEPLASEDGRAVFRSREFTGLDALLVSAIDGILQIPQPFADFVEGTQQIVEMYQSHSIQLGRAASTMGTALMDLATDILVMVQPQVRHLSIPPSALVEAGLPAEAPLHRYQW